MQLAGPALGGTARRGDRTRGHIESTPGLDEECPTGGGQAYTSGSAFEHGGAELVLQITDLLGKRRLGDTQACRRGQETAFLGDSDEIAKMA